MQDLIDKFLENHPTYADKQEEIKRFIECFEDIFKAAMIAPTEKLSASSLHILTDKKYTHGIESIKYFFTTALQHELSEKTKVSLSETECKEELKIIERLDVEDEQIAFANAVNSFVDMGTIMKNDADNSFYRMCVHLLNTLVESKRDKVIKYSVGGQSNPISSIELLIKMDAFLASLLNIAGAENPISYSDYMSYEKKAIVEAIIASAAIDSRETIGYIEAISSSEVTTEAIAPSEATSSNKATTTPLFTRQQDMQRNIAANSNVRSQAMATGAIAAGAALVLAATIFSPGKIKIKSRL